MTTSTAAAVGTVLIVTRHKGALDWLARHLYPGHHRGVVTDDAIEWWPLGLEPGDPENAPWRRIRHVATATPEDVRPAASPPGAVHVVVGNVPLHLAAVATAVIAIEFDGPAPRGAEYTADDMERAGARLAYYRVERTGRAGAPARALERAGR